MFGGPIGICGNTWQMIIVRFMRQKRHSTHIFLESKKMTHTSDVYESGMWLNSNLLDSWQKCRGGEIVSFEAWSGSCLFFFSRDNFKITQLWQKEIISIHFWTYVHLQVPNFEMRWIMNSFLTVIHVSSNFFELLQNIVVNFEDSVLSSKPQEKERSHDIKLI